MMTPEEIANKELKEKKYEHTERVVKLCHFFSDNLPSVDRELLETAAWLHDVTKGSLNKKGEPLHANPHIYKAVLEKYQLEREQDVIDIMVTHKGKFNPEKHCLECSILRVCDKLDKYQKAKRQCKKQAQKDLNRAECTEDIKAIREILDSDTYRRFSEIYEVVHKEMKKMKGFKKTCEKIEDEIKKKKRESHVNSALLDFLFPQSDE